MQRRSFGFICRMATQPSRVLDTFPNPNPGRDYEISFEAPEFTCLCPVTGQPDFATIRVWYVPDAKCVELKSLKLYLWSFRNEGAFHEAVTNQICDDLVAAIDPRRITVEGDFFVRGGIHTKVRVTHEKQSEPARETRAETAGGTPAVQ
jgi:7-cyano-7-deazaguanine reductase